MDEGLPVIHSRLLDFPADKITHSKHTIFSERQCIFHLQFCPGRSPVRILLRHVMQWARRAVQAGVDGEELLDALAGNVERG